MSTAVYDQFIRDIRSANSGFTEKRSSLKDLLVELRRQLGAGAFVAFASVDDAKGFCKKRTDSRLTKYNVALTNLVRDWGKVVTTTPSTRVVTATPIMPSVPLPRVVVPRTMSGNPDTVVRTKWSELETLAGYASMDATTFGGTTEAIRKEEAAKGDDKRMRAYQAATQAAAGKKSLPQSILKSVYDKTTEGQAAVCTTFALAAAQVLTDGSRQTGTVRIEVFGSTRGLATHMYVVAGRDEASDVGDMSTWGDKTLIVDPWGTATYGNNLAFKASNASKIDMYAQKPQKFYDNMAPDPKEETIVRDVMSIERQIQLARQQKAQSSSSPKPSWVRD